MAADIHAVSLVANSARQASDLGAGFDKDRLDTAVTLKFDGCG